MPHYNVTIKADSLAHLQEALAKAPVTVLAWTLTETEDPLGEPHPDERFSVPVKHLFGIFEHQHTRAFTLDELETAMRGQFLAWAPKRHVLEWQVSRLVQLGHVKQEGTHYRLAATQNTPKVIYLQFPTNKEGAPRFRTLPVSFDGTRPGVDLHVHYDGHRYLVTHGINKVSPQSPCNFIELPDGEHLTVSIDYKG